MVIQTTYITTAMIILIAFSIGFIFGWVLSNRRDVTSKSRLRTIIAVVITVGWITATVSGIVYTTYTVSPLLHALMGGIVGYFFTDDGVSFNIGGEK